MKPFKRLALVLCAAAAMAAAPARAGVPTVDLVAIAADAISWIEQFTHMVDQINQMKAQYTQMKSTADALKGGRGMGLLLSDPAVRQALDPGFIDTMDRLRALGAAGATDKARAVYASVKAFDCGSQFPDNPGLRRQCESRSLAIPTLIATLNESLERSRRRVGALGELIAQVDSAPDAKAAADLQNRIAAEVALLSNEKAMMDTAQAQLQAQGQLNLQAAREAGLKRLLQAGSNPFGR
jgi:type IV secretion system protein VirB5